MIRKAKKTDADAIMGLLFQVASVHNEGRPDIFKPNTTKYTKSELEKMIEDEEKIVFVYEDENSDILAHAFCEMIVHEGDNLLADMRTLYIDDICVDEKARGRRIGKEIYEHVISFAKETRCHNVTLNVWECNENAKKFYEAMGMKVQKTGMETLL
ncbi:MAG: GNAT family N-acetyltransferase [Clostridia bacterium]|nr:GNAT family N-acetyltransferase [Clostridia bacterium]